MATTANSGGNITVDGGSNITSRGICWSNTPSPTIALSSKTNDGIGTGNFTSAITGLVVGNTYYVRAYATNSISTVYGNEVNFSTNLPTITTSAISNITASTATSGGNVSTIGGAPVTARGVCWSTTSNPTVSLDTKTIDGSDLGSFTSSISGLTVGTIYYLRAYATSSIGTTYGAEVSFSTILPTLSTTAISNITASTATCGGNVTAVGGGAVSSRGVCWSTTTNPNISLNTKTTDASGAGIFTSSITGLSSATTYYVRAYATNNIGTAYGYEKTFSTLANFPIISTTTVSNITTTTASCDVNITSDEGSPIIARGVCWSTTSNPTISLNTKTNDGIGIGNFTSTISGLTIGKTYYLRAYATNSIGTTYGTEVNFSTGIGALYLGGKIAYLDASGIHGFVCALADQSTGIIWSPTSSLITNANNTVLETTGVYGITKSGGRKNTDLIIATFGTGSYAASICAALTTGGAKAGDWYLPSQDELNQLWINQTILGGFSSPSYWSSNEGGQSITYAYFQYFGNGLQGSIDRSRLLHVRAIRAF